MLLFTLFMSAGVAAVPQLLTNISTPSTNSAKFNTVSQTTIVSSNGSQILATTTAPTITPDHTNIRDCTIVMPGLGGHIACDINNLLAPRPIEFPTGDPTSRFCYSERFHHRRDCNRTEGPVYTGAYPTIRYEQYAFNTTFEKVNTKVATGLLSYCSSSSEAAISRFLATAEITPDGVLPATLVSTQRGTWFYTGSWSQTTQYHYVSEMDWKPSAPCCLTCTLLGGSAQVFQWPATTADPNVPSSLVNGDGFTFISPSIYVAFETLHAHDLCGPLGPGYNATTVAFDPVDLSTTAAWKWDTSAYIDEPPIMVLPNAMQFTRATFGVASCADIPVSFYQDWRIPGSTYANLVDYSSAYSSILTGFAHDTKTSYSDMWKLYTVTYNPCSPMLSVPTQLYTIDTLWKDCRPGIDAFFDPPYTLTPGKGLGSGPVTTADPVVSDPPAPTATRTAVVLPIPEPVTASNTAPLPVIATPEPPPNPPVIVSLPSPNPPGPAATQTFSPSVINNPPAETSGPTQPSPILIPIEPAASANPTQPAPVVNEPPAGTPDPSQPIPILIPIPAVIPSSNNIIQPSSVVNDPPVGSPDQNQPAPEINNPTVGTGGSNNPTQAAPVVNNLPTGTQNHDSPPAQSQPAVNNPPSPPQQQPTKINSPAPATIVVGQSTIVAGPSSVFIVGTQTLTPGGGIVHSGISYSLVTNAGTLIIGGSSTQIIPVAPPQPTAAPQASYAIGTQTIVAGGPPITYSGATYSLQSDGASLIVNGTPKPIKSYIGTPAYIVGGQTLSEGGSGVVVTKVETASLVAGGSNVVVGTETMPLSKLLGSSTTTALGLGGIIAGIGGFQTPPSSPAPPAPPASSATQSGVVFGAFSDGVFVNSGLKLRAARSGWLFSGALGCWMVGTWVG